MYNKILTKDVEQDARGKILRKMLAKDVEQVQNLVKHLDNVKVHQNTPVKKHFFPRKYE